MNIHKSQLFWCEQKRGTIGFDTLPTSNKWDWPNRNSETVWNSSIFFKKDTGHISDYISHKSTGWYLVNKWSDLSLRCHGARFSVGSLRGFPPWRRFEKTNGLMCWKMATGFTMVCTSKMIWLVVWECHNPNWMNSIIFQRGSIHQPVVINDISILFWGLPSSSFFQFKSMSSSTYFPKKNHGFTVLHHIPDIFQNFPVINPWNPW
jgi:hypothetical protein